ncbi:terpene cyclase/mutase family protein [Gottfriedia luciferensis]|uniref:terpene cyclase/mutase family protein n=1 Tax=Gottfriedia luciferensis TaxID=178774 RepID=UPI000B451098|nr:prenyltransferase/squalene oxidase repeat-containing protein [Gottfriedia luciferensis]
MDLEKIVTKNIEERINRLRGKQKDNGSWEYCFEGSLLTDSFMVLLLNDLEHQDKTLSEGIVDRIINLQHPNGAWKLYEDEKDGNLTATVQAYIALLISKKYTKEHSSMKKAEKFIIENGGIKKTHFMLKMILAIHGLINYPKLFYFPMSYFLLPNKMPLSLFDLSNYARVHLVPMILCINKRFKIKLDADLNIDNLLETKDVEWFYEERGSFYQFLIEEGKKLASYPLYFHQKGYEKAERFILDRIETNGTFYSYASSTFYMIYALMALGYEASSSVIQNALNGLISYATKTEAGIHIQNSPSAVWDTALLSYAIQEAGYATSDPVVSKSINYLTYKQQDKIGDWAINSKNVSPGGWGFSEVNSIIPDNDDTGAVLRALTRCAIEPNRYESWMKGVQFLLGLQNNDGGWGAFEKNVNNKWLTYLPIENAKDAIIDPSTADLTGRALEFIGNYTSITNDDPIVKKSVEWLLKNQESNGSWYGRWGICYIYGTWAAITGLRSVGIPKSHDSVKKAEKWLISLQNEDGGWGESGLSPVKGSYVKLNFSTPSQTAWAVDTLLMIRNKHDEVIKKGINYLVSQSQLSNKELTYPTGLGLPGQFYIHYHSYNEIYPLLALAHFKNK